MKRRPWTVADALTERKETHDTA